MRGGKCKRRTVFASRQGVCESTHPAEWIDKADNPILCLFAIMAIMGLFVLSRLKWRKDILGLSRLDYISAKTGEPVNGGYRTFDFTG